MAQTNAIEKNITTLNQLQARFNLRHSDDDQFFTEWFNGLSPLTDWTLANFSFDRVRSQKKEPHLINLGRITNSCPVA